MGENGEVGEMGFIPLRRGQGGGQKTEEMEI